MKWLRSLYYRIFIRYRILETRFVTYTEGDQMIKDTYTLPESERWVLAPEEDANEKIGMVYLCRKERIR